MKKLLISILSCLLACPFISAQQTIDLTTGVITNGIQSTTPTRDVEIVSDGVIVTYNFTKATLTGDDLYPTSKFVKINGFGMNTNVGEPSTLQRWDSFVVPDNASYTVTVLDSSYIDIPMELAPARPLLPNSTHETYSLLNVLPISSYSGFFPQSIVSDDSLQCYRGTNMLSVQTSPLQYNYVNNTVRAYSEIKYKVYYGVSPLPSPGGTSPNMHNDVWDPFLNNVTLNYNVSAPSYVRGLRSDSCSNDSSTRLNNSDYLILSTPMFNNAVNRFAEWKKTLGFTVHVMMVDSTWTSRYIRSRIKQVYDSCVTVDGIKTLNNVLIIGDYQNVPAEISYETAVDFYYSCLDNITLHHDKTPDVGLGRIPVSSNAQAEIVIDKIINYEKMPPTDAGFYKGVANCAYFQDGGDNNYVTNYDGVEDRRFVKTAEDIRKYLNEEQEFWDLDRLYATEDNVYPQKWSNIYSSGGDIDIQLLKENFSWDINSIASDIAGAFNTGRLLITYRGHGSSNGWGSLYFGKQQIDDLYNQNYLPIVFSITCLSGKFDEDECFAESLIRKSGGGSVAVFASSHETHSGPADVLLLASFDAIWPNPGIEADLGMRTMVPPTHVRVPTYTLGQIINQGKKVMRDLWSDSGGSMDNETIHCFGDPSMNIYTEMPTEFSNIRIAKTEDYIHVDLGTDIAKIVFYNKQTNEVKAYQGHTAECYGNANDYIVCVTAHNRIPYVEELEVSKMYLQNAIITSSNTYEADVIKVGSNVTTGVPVGKVTFGGGSITLKGYEVELQGETEITIGTELEIKND